ncbi:DEAD/DEAH box helicase [Saccharicrinis fermentans]|uniref:DEAD-box ATP-dependent RNA helicase RhpA n=1 Tax=Saccharicrinis fermentans DSM 9555 = JCM 21142 TaxID=869213 RepID=W7Y0Z4_9BACT|nr:DEAD/DEAH box helicase [Saccharicrinis fermentans]GAF04605.1 ATP-dependent RNA helicase RhlE [Saccharicrinis fermentans DSM 9555 = JCM 21142]
MTFKELGLTSALLKAVEKKKYTEPSVIQEKAIPPVLEGRDVLASAQTGTGKTAGFTLPMLQILSQEPPLRRRPVRALVLTPTRELAAQVFENVKEYSEFLNLRSAVVFGGVNIKPQIAKLRNGVDILVATPGRLLDLESQNVVSLSKVEIFVLDEADRMLDMGFARDVNRILKLMPDKRQNLLFSATFSKEIKKLADRFLSRPVTVHAAPENATADKIIQKAYHVAKVDKTAVLVRLIHEGDWQQVLIFTRTKSGANRLGKKLNKRGVLSAEIHGDKSQNARVKALDSFKKGTIKALVATDVAARGLDIPLLPHVVNFELPNVPEDYVHRIGRTGRAGANGEAISLVGHEEMDYLKGIEKLLGHTIPLEIMEGFEPGEAPVEEKKPAKKTFRRNNSTSNKNSKRRVPVKKRSNSQDSK